METIMILAIIGVVLGSDRSKSRPKKVITVKPKVAPKPEFDCEPKWIG